MTLSLLHFAPWTLLFSAIVDWCVRDWRAGPPLLDPDLNPPLLRTRPPFHRTFLERSLEDVHALLERKGIDFISIGASCTWPRAVPTGDRKRLGRREQELLDSARFWQVRKEGRERRFAVLKAGGFRD